MFKKTLMGKINIIKVEYSDTIKNVKKAMVQEKEGWSMAQEVYHLPSKCKASTTKKTSKIKKSSS
jgi:hypothetical protein